MIDWQWCTLDDLSAAQAYAIFALREAVFVVEQTCAYQELDGLDLQADHLVGWSGTEVAAYLRVLGPHTRFDESSIGRVLTAPGHRGTGLGKVLMQKALLHIAERYPATDIRISAQSHLQSFYAAHGFAAASGQYLEDGIPHLEMVLKR